MASADKLAEITKLQAEIAKIKRNNKSAYAAKQQELNNYGLIQVCHGIYLYQDRIIGDGRTIKLDSNVQAAIESNGQISYTTEVKGGGSRPTLTRIAAGGLIAGPLGAVIGATAQKKKKTKTITHEHDDRIVTLTIASDDGYISKSWNGDATEGRNFTTAIMNAVVDYPKNKKDIELRRKQLVSELKELEKDDALVQKEKELDELMKSIPDKDKKEMGQLDKKIKTSFWVSILGLVFCIYPVFGIIAPAIALSQIIGPRKLGAKDGKAKAAFIMTIIGLTISVLMTILFFATYKPSDTQPNVAPESSQETSSDESASAEVKDYTGTDARIAYNELTSNGYTVRFFFDRVNNAGFTEEQLRDVLLYEFSYEYYDEMPYEVTRQEVNDKTVSLYVEYKSVIENKKNR